VVKIKKEKWIGFYPSKSFRINERPNYNEFPSNLNNTMKFIKLLSKEAIFYNEDFYSLKIFEDGVFIIRKNDIGKTDSSNGFDDLAGNLSKFMDYLNTVYLLFESSFLKIRNFAYFEISEITNRNFISIEYENNKVVGLSGIEEDNFYNYSRIAFNQKVEKKVFDDLNENLKKIFRNYNAVKILSETLKALAQYKLTNFSSSLVLSWIIVEYFMNIYWKKFLKERQSQGVINSEIKKEIEKGTDFTMNVVSNILNFNNLFSKDLFKKISHVRKCRNKIVHCDEKYKCKIEDCGKAFEIIKFLIKKYMGIDLYLNTSINLKGF